MDYNYNPEVPKELSEKEIGQRQNALAALAARLGAQLSQIVSVNTAFVLMMFDPRYEGVRTISCDGPVDKMITNLNHFLQKLEENKDAIERHRLEDLARAEIAQAQAEAAQATKQ